MKLPGLSSLNISGKRVLVRASVDVPSDARGRVLETFRLERNLPTIRRLRRGGARIILCGHRGRPNGRRSAAFSLRPVGRALSKLLATPVGFGAGTVDRTRAAVGRLGRGGVYLLENLRFDPREEGGDAGFATELAALADAYVNDDFSTSHRAHTSIALVPRLMPHAAGVSVAAEVQMLERLLRAPRRPFVVVVGGAKVSDKLGALRRLLPRLDAVLVGGASANTLLKARGIKVGRSLVDTTVGRSDLARLLRSPKLRLPVDAVVAPGVDRGEKTTRAIDDIPKTVAIYDLGPATARAYAQILAGARTIFWAGPLGLTESPRFRSGARTVLRSVSPTRAFAVAGGGDTVFALRLLNRLNAFTYCSSGGGATLDFLAGEPMPGLAALQQ